MAGEGLRRIRFFRSLFAILVFVSALLSETLPNRTYGILDSPSALARSKRLPAPVAANGVIVSGNAIRPVAYRLGYSDFISRLDTVTRPAGEGITAACLASLPYPQSAYDRLPLRYKMLVQLRLPRPALEKLGIRVRGWEPRPNDFYGVPLSNLRFLADTSKAMDLTVESRYLDELAADNPGNGSLFQLIHQGPPTLRELGKAGIPLAALYLLPVDAIDITQLNLGPEEALAMGALPPSARQIPLTFGDLRGIGVPLRDMSGLELDPASLIAFSEAATGRPPIDSGSRKSEGMPLSRLLEEAKESSPAVARFLGRRNSQDTLRIDTLGFACLFFRKDSLFMQPQAGEATGFHVFFPHPYGDGDFHPSRTERMFEYGALPTLRIGFGYPDLAFCQAGLDLTQLPIQSMLFPRFFAFQASLTGFAGILGVSLIEIGGAHVPDFFLTYAAEYRREWKDPKAWGVGPVLQFGIFNLGFQTALRYGREWSGDAAFLIQLFPFGD